MSSSVESIFPLGIQLPELQLPVRVLVVSDEPSFRSMIRERLDSPRLDIVVIESASFSVDADLYREVGGCVIDAAIGEDRVVDIASGVTQEAHAAPIILLTDLVSPNPSAQAIAAGVNDYVEKTDLGGDQLVRLLKIHLQLASLRGSLQSVERRYRLLFERNFAGVYQATPEGRILDCNAAYANMYGFDNVEEARRLGVIGPHDGRQTFVDTLNRDGMVANFESHGRRKDGRPVWTLENAILTEDGREIYGTVIDITHRKQLEAQLRQAQKMDAVGRLAGGVAHDFNNLLTTILGYTEMVADALPPGDARRLDLGEVKRAAERATKLTRQLLAFGRKQIMQQRVLDVNTVMSELAKMLPRLVGEDIIVQGKLGEGLSSVKVDPEQLEQVLLNLVVNARDAMPHGGTLTIETANAELDEQYTVGHIGSRVGSYVKVSVIDTGVGMDQATLARIFEPFFTTKEKVASAGLGLSTVYGIVKQNNGYIWVDSEVNRGTSVQIYLPIATPDVSDRSEPVVARQAQPSRGAEVVLLVEDEDLVRQLATGILRRKGYSVIEAHNPAVALEICANRAEPIELMVTDVVMPGMTGRELARRLAPIQPSMRVLYMSGYTEDAIVRRGVLDPDIPFIEKPFTPSSFAQKVREVLDAPHRQTSTSPSPAAVS